jgi:hypothetical protein
MPPRKTSKPEPKVLSVSEQRSAVARLETRIKEISELDVSGISTGDDPPIANLEQRIRATLASIYGEDSAEFNRLIGAANLDTTTYYVTWGDDAGPPISEIQQGVEKGKKGHIHLAGSGRRSERKS